MVRTWPSSPVDPPGPRRNHRRPAPRDPIVAPDWVDMDSDNPSLSLTSPQHQFCSPSSFSNPSPPPRSCNLDMPKKIFVSVIRCLVCHRGQILFYQHPNAANMLKSSLRHSSCLNPRGNAILHRPSHSRDVEALGIVSWPALSAPRVPRNPVHIIQVIFVKVFFQLVFQAASISSAKYHPKVCIHIVRLVVVSAFVL